MNENSNDFEEIGEILLTEGLKIKQVNAIVSFEHLWGVGGIGIVE